MPETKKPLCRKMHAEPPHYECERPEGHKGKHTALLDQSVRERIHWTDAECMSDAFAAKQRRKEDA